jgi:hypothetical protein
MEKLNEEQKKIKKEIIKLKIKLANSLRKTKKSINETDNFFKSFQKIGKDFEERRYREQGYKRLLKNEKRKNLEKLLFYRMHRFMAIYFPEILKSLIISCYKSEKATTELIQERLSQTKLEDGN